MYVVCYFFVARWNGNRIDAITCLDERAKETTSLDHSLSGLILSLSCHFAELYPGAMSSATIPPRGSCIERRQVGCGMPNFKNAVQGRLDARTLCSNRLKALPITSRVSRHTSAACCISSD